MFIRSKSKNTIINTENISSLFQRHCVIVAYIIGEKEGIILGHYATNERALEVVDEITKHINQVHSDVITASMQTGSRTITNFVYQMPEF